MPRCDLEDAVKGKADLDKTGKLLQGNIVDANTRLDEMARALNEAESSKKRLQVENQDLSRQIDEPEAAIANMNKGKIFVPSWSLDSRVFHFYTFFELSLVLLTTQAHGL